MTLKEIAIFKRFIGQHELRKNFIKKYKKSIGMTNNPDSIERYLSNIEPENVISSAVKHFITNEAMGYDFWVSVNQSWKEYLYKMRTSHTVEQLEPDTMHGFYSPLRENWDKEKPWVYEPVSVAQIRCGITKEEDELTGNEAEQTVEDVSETDFGNIEGPLVEFVDNDPLADYDFLEEGRPQSLRLKDNVVSLNFNNGSFKITFNMHASKEIENADMVYARLAKNKTGDVCLILNRTQGVRLSKSTSKNRFNTTINSKDICTKIRTLLDVSSDYSILNIEKLSSTSDYQIFKVTKQ